MTERSLDNIRIATKVLTVSVIPLGVLILASVIFEFVRPEEKVTGFYREELSDLEIAYTIVTWILLGLSVVLPAIIVRRELQKRKVATYLPN